MSWEQCILQQKHSRLSNSSRLLNSNYLRWLTTLQIRKQGHESRRATFSCEGTSFHLHAYFILIFLLVFFLFFSMLTFQIEDCNWNEARKKWWDANEMHERRRAMIIVLHYHELLSCSAFGYIVVHVRKIFNSKLQITLGRVVTYFECFGGTYFICISCMFLLES